MSPLGIPPLLDQTLIHEFPIMLAQYGKFTRLAVHCSMPHVRFTNRLHEINFHVFLQHTERSSVGGIGRGNHRILALFFETLWFEGRVQAEIEV